jgi:hypothetical protein
MVQEDGSIVIDPLPVGLDYFALEGAPFRGKRIDVHWAKPGKSGPDDRAKPGLTVRVNGQQIVQRANFRPGDMPVRIEIR